MTPVPVYHVPRRTAPLSIDGRLDELDWIAAPRLSFVKFSHDPEDHQPLRDRTQAMALWDDANLYLAVVIQDRDIWATRRERDARLWPEECVEFYIDPDGDGRRYVEAQINSLNNLRDLLIDGDIASPTPAQYDAMARWDFQRIQTAVQLHRDDVGADLGWTLEIAIPWPDLAFSRRTWPPRPGEALRINFYRYERSSPARPPLPLELSGWSPVHGDFHQPVRFGMFVFAS